MKNQKVEKRIRRHKKIRSTIFGTKNKPRISVFKSNKELFVQVIDDQANKTLLSISTKTSKGKTKIDKSKSAAIELGKKMLKKEIKEGVFDRGGNNYTGRVATFAEGLREAGLKI